MVSFDKGRLHMIPLVILQLILLRHARTQESTIDLGNLEGLNHILLAVARLWLRLNRGNIKSGPSRIRIALEK